MSVVTPARLPPSTSTFFTHSLSVCGAQPIFEEIDRIADHRDPYSPSLFKTIRTARSRTSVEYLFVVLFVIAPSYSGVGASDNPGAVQFAPIKSAEQQAVLSLHRARDLLVRQRTTLINALRGHCGAFGIITSVGACNIGKLIDIIEDHEDKRIPELARSGMGNASAFD